ncbi:MAG: glycosyltransferase [Bacteroidota bacterium]
MVIPTYNCASFLRETLASVIAQDLGPERMEIIVVDDCSNEDNPKAIVDSIKQRNIQFYQHQVNVGKSANYSKGISLSKGHYIHLLHGDDTVNKGFYAQMEALFNENPEASASFCRCSYINAKNEIVGETRLISNSKGIIDDFVMQIAIWQLIQPPSIVFKRHVYETIGSYDMRLRYIEDWEFYVRASNFFKFAYVPKILANYRIFDGNSSSKSMQGGKRVATLHQVIKIIDGYLPQEIISKIRPKRNEAVAKYLLNFIPSLMANKDLKGLIITTKAFSKYNSNLRLWGRWLKFIIGYKKYH